MKPRYPRLFIGLAFAAAVVSAAAAPLRVLYFTKSSGYEHPAIQQSNGGASVSEKVLTKLAAEHDMVVTVSKDGSLFTPTYLAQFDVLLFYTSGDLTSTGTDRYPGITGTGLQALFDYVAGGGGFVGLHSTSDTFHTNERGGGNNPIRLPRYKNYGEAADRFVKMLGGEFIRHGAQQVTKATITDPKFPGFGTAGGEVNVQEEWYTLKEFAPDLHVLLVLNTEGMKGGDYQRANYPIAWARAHGKGRVAYNAMGHRDDVWDAAYYQSMLVGLLEWAGGRVQADVTPNLTQVAPHALQLQPVPADVKQ